MEWIFKFILLNKLKLPLHLGNTLASFFGIRQRTARVIFEGGEMGNTYYMTREDQGAFIGAAEVLLAGVQSAYPGNGNKIADSLLEQLQASKSHTPTPTPTPNPTPIAASAEFFRAVGILQAFITAYR